MGEHLHGYPRCETPAGQPCGSSDLHWEECKNHGALRSCEASVVDGIPTGQYRCLHDEAVKPARAAAKAKVGKAVAKRKVKRVVRKAKRKVRRAVRKSRRDNRRTKRKARRVVRRVRRVVRRAKRSAARKKK
jgi:hypothetical protein